MALGASPQTPVIGLRSSLAMASEPCQGPALAKAGSAPNSFAVF